MVMANGKLAWSAEHFWVCGPSRLMSPFHPLSLIVTNTDVACDYTSYPIYPFAFRTHTHRLGESFYNSLSDEPLSEWLNGPFLLQARWSLATGFGTENGPWLEDSPLNFHRYVYMLTLFSVASEYLSLKLAVAALAFSSQGHNIAMMYHYWPLHSASISTHNSTEGDMYILYIHVYIIFIYWVFVFVLSRRSTQLTRT